MKSSRPEDGTPAGLRLRFLVFPITAREVDELLLEFNTFIGATLILVTHELGTIENFASRCILLDREEKGILASGRLEELRGEGADRRVHKFFGRRIDHPV